MDEQFHSYIVRAWVRVHSAKMEDGSHRRCMAELEVRAHNGMDAARIAALDLGLSESDWNDGSAKPPVVMRVEDAWRAMQRANKGGRK